MTEQILALVRLLLGCGAEEEALLTALERAAEAELRGRLKEGILPEDCAEAFLCAGAFLTMAAWTGSRTATGAVASFSAGELSIREKTEKERDQGAENLRAQAFHMMAPYCRDTGFCFCGVRG